MQIIIKGKMQITITRTLQDDGQSEVRLEVDGAEICRGEINATDLVDYNNLKVYLSSPDHPSAEGKISKFLLENISEQYPWNAFRGDQIGFSSYSEIVQLW